MYSSAGTKSIVCKKRNSTSVCGKNQQICSSGHWHRLAEPCNASHQDNMSVRFIPPFTPLLYSKTGVYRGKHYFLIFASKHRLWVLVRTAVPTIDVLNKNKKNIRIFRLKINIFTAVKYCCILHGRVCIMSDPWDRFVYPFHKLMIVSNIMTAYYETG